jgi:hypothetical protein
MGAAGAATGPGGTRVALFAGKPLQALRLMANRTSGPWWRTP